MTVYCCYEQAPAHHMRTQTEFIKIMDSGPIYHTYNITSNIFSKQLQ